MLGKAQSKWVLLRFIKRYQNELRANDKLWGSVAWRLLEVNSDRRALRWTSDWATRGQASANGLLSAVIIHRRFNEVSQAQLVSRAAVKLPRSTDTTLHELWLALDDALDGQPDMGLAFLKRVPEESLNTYYQFIFRLLEAVTNECPCKNPRGHLNCAVGALPGFRRTPELRRAYRDSIMALARQRGTVGAWFWGKMKVVFAS